MSRLLPTHILLSVPIFVKDFVDDVVRWVFQKYFLIFYDEALNLLYRYKILQTVFYLISK